MSSYFVYDFNSKRYTAKLNGFEHAVSLAAKAEREHFGRVIVEIDERKKPLVVYDNRLQNKGGRIINCLRFEQKKEELTAGEEAYVTAILHKDLPETEQVIATMILQYGFEA